MRIEYLLSLLALATAGCSSSSSSQDTTSTSGSTSGGPDMDAGMDAAAPPACGDPKATPDQACGTLGWKTSDVKSRLRNHHFTFIAETKSGPFLYAIGGVNAGSLLKDADRAPIMADGSIGAFVPDTGLAYAAGGLTGGLVGKVVVTAGGMRAGGVTDQALSAIVGDDGKIGTWKGAGSVLQKRMHPGGFVDNDNIYVLGGFDDPDVWDDVVRATVSQDGKVSTWMPAGKLPAPRSHMSVSLVDGYVYLTGGLDKSAYDNPPVLTVVSRGKLEDDGTLGDWADMPKLPAALCTHASFFYGGYLYVGGGIGAALQEKRVWRAPINADHSLGAWEDAAPLPLARGHVHQFPMFENHVYSVAGAIDFNLNSTDHVEIGTFE